MFWSQGFKLFSNGFVIYMLQVKFDFQKKKN